MIDAETSFIESNNANHHDVDDLTFGECVQESYPSDLLVWESQDEYEFYYTGDDKLVA